MGKRIGSKDQRYELLESWMSYMLRRDFPVVIFENVCEYDKHLLQESFQGQYTVLDAAFDVRCLGHGASRARNYAVLVHKERAKWVLKYTLLELLEAMSAIPQMRASNLFYLEDAGLQRPLTASQQLFLDSYYSIAAEVVDLSQYGNRNWARTECSDGSLMTLTTNSLQIYSKVCHRPIAQTVFYCAV
jgi:hypothetical protein